MKNITVKVKSQISKCTPVLLRLAKHNKLKVTLGKTASGMDEVTLVGDPDMIKSVRKLWAEETAIKPKVTRFPRNSKQSHYYGTAALIDLEEGDVILMAPSSEALSTLIKSILKVKGNDAKFKEVHLTEL